MESLLAMLDAKIALQSDPSHEMWERVHYYREARRLLGPSTRPTFKVDCMPRES